MKLIYLVLGSSALFLVTFMGAVTFATTRAEGIVFQLKSAPTKWRIEVLEDNFYFSKADEAKLKKDVLGFFDLAGTPTYRKLDHYRVYLCIVIAFSALGFLRECCMAKLRNPAE